MRPVSREHGAPYRVASFAVDPFIITPALGGMSGSCQSMLTNFETRIIVTAAMAAPGAS